MSADLKRASSILAQLQPMPPNERSLTSTQREWLAAWRKRQQDLASTGEEAAAVYALSLASNYVDPDPIRTDIEVVLSPELARHRILETDSDGEAAQKYHEYCQLKFHGLGRATANHHHVERG